MDRRFINACAEGDVKTVAEILNNDEAKLDLNHELFMACFSGQLEIVKLILAKKLNSHKRDTDCLMWALNSAAQGGRMDVVKLLMLYDPSYFDHTDALMYACIGGNIDIVKLMINKGACFLNRCLDQAFVYNHTHIQNFLILKMKKIPEHTDRLSYEQLYYLYKKGVSPSKRYNQDFYEFYTTEQIAKEFLMDKMIPELVFLINSY